MIKKIVSSLDTLLVSVMLIVITLPVTAANLTLGSISDDPTRELKYYLPIAKYLVSELQSASIVEGNVMVAQSIDQMAQFLKKGNVDIYFDSPFPTIETHRLSASIPILRRWKKGVSSYYSVVFVRQDSDIKVPEDLQGKLIAFEEPYSTGSYSLPKASLKSLGLDFIEKKPSIFINDKQIKYKFTGDDINTLVWVLSKRVHAGAMSSNSFNLLAANQRSKLRIIHSTVDVPRHIVSIRNDLDPVLASKIKNILLQMHQSENGRKVLQKFKKTAKFDEFPDGVDMAIESLNKLNTFLHN